MLVEGQTNRQAQGRALGDIAKARGASRNEVLDFLRALAITLVICYHVVQMSPLPLPNLAAVTRWGQYGVDLFFVLSGWLIGGLTGVSPAIWGMYAYLRAGGDRKSVV